MDERNFEELDHTIQMSLIFAMYIRNEMEGFHRDHLTDQQMQELNLIIRQALYNMLRYLKLAAKEENDNEKLSSKNVINYQIQLIPNYWELPTEDAFRKDLYNNDGDWNSKCDEK